MGGLRSHGVPEGVETEGWALEVHGSVSRPLRLDGGDLAALPTETFTEDFDCVEGWTAAGLSWRGVRMREILDRADPENEGGHALVRSLDGEYACSFPIDRLTEAILAVELDGEPLAPEHGGPARLIPTGGGSDCWESVKWVSEIEIAASPIDAESTARAIALGRLE